MAAGALNLASPEVKIHLESAESSDPIDVEQKKLLETNSLVEEFMLLANISVAQKIEETFPQTAVLRRHLPPPPTNFEKLQDILLKRKGISLDVSSSGALAASLDKCEVRIHAPPMILKHPDMWSGSRATCIQHTRTNLGHKMHVVGRIFLLWECRSRHLWSLRVGKPDLYPLYQPHP